MTDQVPPASLAAVLLVSVMFIGINDIHPLVTQHDVLPPHRISRGVLDVVEMARYSSALYERRLECDP